MGNERAHLFLCCDKLFYLARDYDAIIHEVKMFFGLRKFTNCAALTTKKPFLEFPERYVVDHAPTWPRRVVLFVGGSEKTAQSLVQSVVPFDLDCEVAHKQWAQNCDGASFSWPHRRGSEDKMAVRAFICKSTTPCGIFARACTTPRIKLDNC